MAGKSKSRNYVYQRRHVWQVSLLVVWAVSSYVFFQKQQMPLLDGGASSSMASINKKKAGAAVVPAAVEDKDAISSSKFAKMNKMQRRASWAHLIPQLPVCRYMPRACEPKLMPEQWLLVTAADAKMRHDIGIMGGIGIGMGGFLLSLVALLCAALGITGIGLSFSSSTGTSLGDDKVDAKEMVSDTDGDLIENDNRAASSLKSFSTTCSIRRLLNNSMTYWTGAGSSPADDNMMTFTHPVATFKFFIAALLFIELNDLNQHAVIATPELIELHRSKPSHHPFVPHVVDWLMPTLNGKTTDVWVQRLQYVRAILLLSWFVYLLLPPSQTCLSGISYSVGAMSFIYLGCIGLMYCLAHRTQGIILFLFFSIFAVPFLACPKHGPRAARWLRRMLYLGVLIPIYLFAGIAKFRYKGIATNLSGQWITEIFHPHKVARSTLPSIYLFVRRTPWAAMLVSWGNIFIEIILPIVTLLHMENRMVQALFHFSIVMFHLSIFLLMSPNFLTNCLLHLLCANPLGWWSFSTQRRGTEQTTKTANGNNHQCSSSSIMATNNNIPPVMTWMDWVRLLVAFYTIVGWFEVQFTSDIQHLTETLSHKKKRDPYFPFTEVSMFAVPTKEASYALGLAMATFSALAYAYVIFFRKPQPQQNNDGKDHNTALPLSKPNDKVSTIDIQKLPLKERMDLAQEGPTLVFDGICNLCNGSMSWFAKRCHDDSPVWYMWAQHEDTHAFLDEIGISRHDIKTSWAYIEDGVVYRGSTAWLMALKNLSAPWCYLSKFGKMMCPTFIRESIYKIVAANRYNALGHSDACQRPNPSMKARFLHSTFVSGGDQETGLIPPVQRKRLLVIGCGPAGLNVAKKMAKSHSHSVVVVEPKDFYEFTPGILRGMCDPTSTKDLVFKLEPVLCDNLGIGLVQGLVTELGSNRATVRRALGGTLRKSSGNAVVESLEEDPNMVHIDFDYCVIAAGSQYATSRLWKVPTNHPDAKPTAGRPSSRSSYTLESRLEELAEEHHRLQQLKDKRAGCVSIMGAGLVGVELAAEIRHFFPQIRSVKLFDPMPTVLPTLSESAQNYATKWMTDHDVELVLGNKFDDEALEAERYSDVVYRCAGVKPNASSFLPQCVLDDKGHVRVNAALQVVQDGKSNLFGAGRVFAIGDCITMERACTNKSCAFTKDIYPAEAMAQVVVANLHCALTVQCIQTRPGVLHEIGPLMEMTLCSLGPEDCIFLMDKRLVVRGKLASLMKQMIQYTKMSDSRNELLGTTIWSLVPHW